MTKHRENPSNQRLRRSLIAVASAALASGALAQEDPNKLEAVVVTGFRASLNSALNLKKNADGLVDVIKAEDVSKFPDANLAESLQRVPGVALARGDGGEGKQITVRGLNAGFTRVRINGNRRGQHQRADRQHRCAEPGPGARQYLRPAG